MDAHICSSHELLLTPNAVSFRDRAIRVGQKSERKVVLRFELFVSPFAVWRNTEDGDPSFLELRKRVTKRAGFFCTTRRVVFRIKIKHHFLTTKILQTDSFTVCIVGLKSRRSGSFFDHVSSSGG